MVDAFVALGANLGNPAATLRLMPAELAKLPLTRVVAVSALYRSQPMGVNDDGLGASGPDYINGVVQLQTGLTAPALLAELLALERRFGRVRSATERYGPRTLDLDLLLYGGGRVSSASLTVPHPRMAERAFVLQPLAELAPNLSIPGLGTVAEHLARVAGQALSKL